MADVQRITVLPFLEKLWLEGNPLAFTAKYQVTVFSYFYGVGHNIYLDGRLPTRKELAAIFKMQAAPTGGQTTTSSSSSSSLSPSSPTQQQRRTQKRYTHAPPPSKSSPSLSEYDRERDRSKSFYVPSSSPGPDGSPDLSSPAASSQSFSNLKTIPKKKKVVRRAQVISVDEDFNRFTSPALQITKEAEEFYEQVNSLKKDNGSAWLISLDFQWYQRRVRGTNSEMETLNQQFSKLSTTESSQTVRVDVTSEVTHLKFDVCHEVLGMVTIKAPFCENLETQRAPLDLVAVLDQSGSMSGDKIEMVKNSMMFAISQLKTDDRLAIVLFETEVQVLFELKFMDAKNKQEATDLIKLISTKNMTALAGGLFQGLDLLIKDQETTTTTTTTTYNNNNNNNNNNNFNNLLSSIGQ
eukprot:TRINITY_DN2855_c0_g1_i1.p1 TRINITY_DN2855_c0_g1~~TRINITY_DN2855_c0_g1_i1.p1  ORF type:complete len:463 (-),score=166.75 TRINITY_DN2855_c0_g1_i1:171-1400(-)